MIGTGLSVYVDYAGAVRLMFVGPLNRTARRIVLIPESIPPSLDAVPRCH